MNSGLTGRVAMVAAASKGIGLAIAQGLAAEGCRVSICARTAETVAVAAGTLGEHGRGYVADVADPEALARWAEATEADLGPPLVLVTNTGGPPAGSLDALDDAAWERGFQSTLMNAVRLSRLVLPHMRRAGWGRIVHISSLYAREPAPELPLSSVLRAGLDMLTLAQAREYAGLGITVNAVLPGHTMTDRQLHLAEIRAAAAGVDVDEALRRQAAATSIGRLAEPAEIASAALYFASAGAGYTTGVRMLVDGGMTRGL